MLCLDYYNHVNLQVGKYVNMTIYAMTSMLYLMVLKSFLCFLKYSFECCKLGMPSAARSLFPYVWSLHTIILPT